MDDEKVFKWQECKHCDISLKVSGMGKFPCAWDALAEAQRDFLIRSGVDAEWWCSHRDNETRAFNENGGAQEVPVAKPTQGDLI